MTAKIPVPYAIRRLEEGATIEIEWEQGAHTGRFRARDLRLACPCAECVEEMSGRSLLDPARVPEDVRPLQIELVGAYGLKVRWSDGHGTGIYTFDWLRRDCPCARCGAR